MKANNHRLAFEVTVQEKVRLFPFICCRAMPNSGNEVRAICIDRQKGRQCFTFQLSEGQKETITLDQVLDCATGAQDIISLLLELEQNCNGAVPEINTPIVQPRLKD